VIPNGDYKMYRLTEPVPERELADFLTTLPASARDIVRRLAYERDALKRQVGEKKDEPGHWQPVGWETEYMDKPTEEK